MSDYEEDVDGDLLPEDDSIFEDIGHDANDLTYDSIVDDSFSSVLSSTPAGKVRNSPRPSTRSPKRKPSNSAAKKSLISSLNCSPRPTTRSQSRACSPLPVSPVPCTPRSTTGVSSSPRPTTRSQTRDNSPVPGSPNPQRAGRNVTSSDSPRPTTRSQTRAASPFPNSPGPSTRSTARCLSAIPQSSRTGIEPLPPRQSTSTARFNTKLKCPMCPSLFANETTLATHKKRHALKRAFTRAATLDEFLEALPELMMKALSKVMKEPLIGTIAESVNEFATVVNETFKDLDESHQLLFKYIGEKFHSILSDHSAIFSSTLQFTFLVGVNQLLNSDEFRSQVSGLILGLYLMKPPGSKEILNVFLSNFIVQLSYCAVIYYVQKIHGFNASQEVRKKRSDDTLDSKEFLQLSYHIGGSIVSGYLYKGEKYKASSWKSFVSVLRNKFLRVQAVGNACADEVRMFTESQDRGGLKHISQEALDFFVVIFDLLMSLEGPDGSLPPNVVHDYILKDDIVICLWDTLVGSDLHEDASVDFLEKVANSCKMVVMKGIMKRKLNNYLKKAVASVPLRCRLT